MAKVFADVAAVTGDRFGAGEMINGDCLTPFFGVKRSGDFCGATSSQNNTVR
jgi:hypothetical protein